MAKVTGFTAQRMYDIEQASVVSGAIEGEDELILYTRGGARIRAGVIKGGTAEWIKEYKPIIDTHDEIIKDNYAHIEDLYEDINRLEPIINQVDTSLGEMQITVNQTTEKTLEALTKADAAGDSAQVALDKALKAADDLDKLQIGGVNLAALSSLSIYSGGTRDGYRFTFDKTGTTNPAIRVLAKVFNPDTDYVVTFWAQKISGDVDRLGGHCDITPSAVTVFRDGVDISNLYNGWRSPGSGSGLDDLEPHFYEVRFKTLAVAQFEAVGDKNWYIQPNRTAYGPIFKLELWDLQIERGNKATDWSPAPEDVQQGIDDAKDQAQQGIYLANLAKAQADGAVWVGPSEPPLSARVSGQVWVQTSADDRMVGVKVLRDHLAPVAVWDDYAMLTGLLIVPGADGIPTIIDQNGMVIGTIIADAITSSVLAADSVGAKQLIIGEVERKHLDDSVDGILSNAEDWSNRVIILPESITISKNLIGGNKALTALRLEATRLSFIVDNQTIAYMDSSKNIMSIGNAYVQDSIQIGEHQVKRLGESNITIFQWVGV